MPGPNDDWRNDPALADSRRQEEERAQRMLDVLLAGARPTQDFLAAQHSAPRAGAPLTPTEAEQAGPGAFPFSPVAYDAAEDEQIDRVGTAVGIRQQDEADAVQATDPGFAPDLPPSEWVSRRYTGPEHAEIGQAEQSRQRRAQRMALEAMQAEQAEQARRQSSEAERIAAAQARSGAYSRQVADRARGDGGLQTFADATRHAEAEIPGTDYSYSPGAVAMGLGDGLTLGHADELAGGAMSLARGTDYQAEQERAEGISQEAQRRNPGSYATGILASLPMTMALPGVNTSGMTGTGAALARVGSGITQGAIAGEGFSTAEMGSRELFDDTARGGAFSGLAGSLGEAAVVAAPRLIEGVGRMADRLDDASAPIRVRSAGPRTVGEVRRVDQLPGGARGFAQSLDDLGIAPRGSVGTVDQVGARAAEAEQRATR
jgi:hypothetical protein